VFTTKFTVVPLEDVNTPKYPAEVFNAESNVAMLVDAKFVFTTIDLPLLHVNVKSTFAIVKLPGV
jgi:hypothetical protein